MRIQRRHWKSSGGVIGKNRCLVIVRLRSVCAGSSGDCEQCAQCQDNWGGGFRKHSIWWSAQGPLFYTHRPPLTEPRLAGKGSYPQITQLPADNRREHLWTLAPSTLMKSV